MQVFIWNRVKKCSDNYHQEGGVVVIADNLDRARELANSVDGCLIQDDEKPDYFSDVSDVEEKVFIMPDAGCC